MNKAYGKSNITELFLSILPAQIFSFVTSSLSGIVNGIVIGNFLTSLDMIALGFATPIVQIIAVCSTIVSAGARILCGKFIGRGDNKKVNETFTSSIILLVIIGLIITILGFLFSSPLALLISNVETASRTAAYIRGLSIGALPTMIVPCLMVFLQMKNENNYALLSTVVLAVSNLVIALLAMKYINANIFTIGLITSIAQYITLLFVLIRFVKNKDLPRLCKNDSSLYKEILVIGLPSALSSILYALRNSILNTIASNNFGLDAVNALSILTASCGPIDAINIGLGQTVLMLASVYIGEKDKDALLNMTRIAFKVGLILGFAKVGLLALFSGNIADVYGANEQVRALTVSLYMLYSLCMPLNMITCSLVSIYQVFGKITYCNVLIILMAFIFPLAFVLLTKSLFGVYSIFDCYWIAELLILITMYLYVSLKKKKVVKNLNDLVVIDEQLEVGKHISISINKIEDVSKISQTIQKYCLEEKIDKTRSMIAGLCTEEIASNIIEHGFTKSKKKKKFIDIYADVEEDKINIRIKDNAVPFDPHIKINDSSDITQNIGIKMVSKLANSMIYQNSFGLNVLTIVL